MIYVSENFTVHMESVLTIIESILMLIRCIPMLILSEKESLGVKPLINFFKVFY